MVGFVGALLRATSRQHAYGDEEYGEDRFSHLLFRRLKEEHSERECS